MPHPPDPIEPSPETLRRWTDQAVDYALDHVNALADAPSWDHDGVEAAVRAVREPVPEHGRPLGEILAKFDAAMAKSYNNAGPGFLAYIPGGGIPSAGLADLIACFTNRYVTVTQPAPALAEIETVTLGWLAELMGM